MRPLIDNYTPKRRGLPDHPLIEITIKNAADKMFNQTAIFLIDSGADFIMIKKDLYDSLNLRRVSDQTMEVADGQRSTNEWSYVNIEIPRLNIEKELLQAIKTNASFNLLGRNFLNNFCIVLNGLKLEYKMYA